MRRSETSYLKATIATVRASYNRHDYNLARLTVEELSAIALHTDKKRIRISALQVLKEASKARSPAARFAAEEALEMRLDPIMEVGEADTSVPDDPSVKWTAEF